MPRLCTRRGRANATLELPVDDAGCCRTGMRATFAAAGGDYDLGADAQIATSKETMQIPELIKDWNDTAPVARI